MERDLKKLWQRTKNDIFLGIVFVLMSLLSFGLGRMSAIRGEKNDSRALKFIETNNSRRENTESSDFFSVQNLNINADSQRFVASKNGCCYHLPSCSGAQRIKEENKIWFSSKEDAEKAGYEPAKNCPGI